MKKILLLVLLSAITFTSCGKKQMEVSKGVWRGTIQLNDNPSESLMPFLFTWNKGKDGKDEITIINADEKIPVNEITYSGDSVFIKLPVFKDEIKAKIVSKDSIAGLYYHVGSRSKYTMPFYAIAGKEIRFGGEIVPPSINISGRWETTVAPGDSAEYKIVGEFKQTGNKLTGTFLTTAGDHRYLDGIVTGSKMKLSSVDGNHTILITADITKDGMLENGLLIGGPKWREKWIAVKNENFKLPEPETITKIKEGTGVIDFTFADMTGKRISLSDEKYKGKPVVVQLMGSWCPNCMDETRFFNELFPKYNPKGLQIIGLSFETNNFEESKDRIERFVKQLNAKYDFLYAGEVGKNINETLPFIEKLNGYPTTLYLNKEHKIVTVYTGFSGPGTGEHYTKTKEEIIKTIESLL
ncbi:MAG: peroxiredoxin family protein [Ignavibacteria bacterium]